MDVGNEALDLLDVKEVTTRLRLSPVTIRHLIKSGELKAVRAGRRVLVKPEAVIAYKNALPSAARGEPGDQPAA